MDAIQNIALIATAMVIGLGFLGAAALLFGVDSRPTIGDDHAR
jgi:hypothetical protein